MPFLGDRTTPSINESDVFLVELSLKFFKILIRATLASNKANFIPFNELN